MHLLHRDPQAPACLKSYSHGRDTWSMQSPTVAERSEIWEKLNAMQGSRCAYCEVAIQQHNRQIEHFRQRSRYQPGTFVWSNLFGSCKRDGVCGVHKDQCGNYPHTDLIKPDVDDPDEFLVFDSQGGVHPKAGLKPNELRRAKETIRILNLDGGGLPQMRRAAASGFLQTVEEWAEFASLLPEEEWRPYVEQALEAELTSTVHQPFATAIRHTLTRACFR